MTWFSLVTVAISCITLIGGILQAIDSIRMSKVSDELFVSLIKRFPPVSARLARTIIFILITVMVVISLDVFISFAFSSSNGKNPSVVVPQYATYQSNTDVPGFTTHLAWDIAPVVQHSLSIALDMRQSNNTTTITKLSKKFGPTYTFFVVAQLDADSSTFTATPKEQMQEQIDQGDLSFHWIATPLHTGDQAVDVIVTGIWVPQNSSNKQIEYYLGSHTWHIAVADDNQPPIIFGQINISAALGYAASVLVSVAFLSFVKDYIDSRRKPKKQESTVQSEPKETQPIP